MIAVDTNILVHAHRRDASLHDEAAACVRHLAESLTPWCVCYHSLVEYCGIATHPKLWSPPSTARQVAAQVQAWRESPSLRILTDSDDTLDSLFDLMGQGKAVGPMVHDARIAACCHVHGVTELWTVDRDFSRFASLRTRNPLG